MCLKRSFDYFKTLKDLACINQQSFDALSVGKDFQNASITFYGKRYELLQRLSDDFVAPIERNDIYNLTNCIYSQFCEIVILGDIIDDIALLNEFTNSFKTLFKMQADIFQIFDKKSNYSTIIKSSRNGQQQALTLGRSISSVATNRLKSDSQLIYKYFVISKVIDFCFCINQTFCECERVAINNI